MTPYLRSLYNILSTLIAHAILPPDHSSTARSGFPYSNWGWSVAAEGHNGLALVDQGSEHSKQMITAKQLKELLEQVPDDAKIIAYENELSVFRGELFGRIEASASTANEDEHDLTAFVALAR